MMVIVTKFMKMMLMIIIVITRKSSTIISIIMIKIIALMIMIRVTFRLSFTNSLARTSFEELLLGRGDRAPFRTFGLG